MHVSKTIEQEDGSVKFEGDLSQPEVDMVITAGLNFLLMKGALPFQIIDTKNKASIMPTSSDVAS